MFNRLKSRRGFTLIETVVTVGIIAAMAAIVIPQVAKQFDAADPTRVQNDLKGLQTAIETFNVNLSGSYPGDLDDLANPLDTVGTIAGNDVDTTLTGVGGISEFGNEVNSWIGPYVDFGVSAGATKSTGFESLVLHNFVCYVGSGTDPNTRGGAAGQMCPDIDPDERLFLAVRLTGLTVAQFEEINDLLDGSNEADGSGATQSQSIGRVRLQNDTTFFLAIPLS